MESSTEFVPVVKRQQTLFNAACKIRGLPNVICQSTGIISEIIFAVTRNTSNVPEAGKSALPCTMWSMQLFKTLFMVI